MKIKEILIKFLPKVLALSVIGLAVISVGALSAPIYAADAPAYRLQISPLKYAFPELAPGQSYEGEVEVQNTGTKAYEYRVSVSPYNVSSASYDARFDASTKYNEIVDWIEILDSEGTVEPGQSNKVRYTVNVPNDVPNRAQRAAIVVEMLPGDKKNETANTTIESISRIASLIYGNVGSGETRRKGEITANNIPGFLFEPPIVATSTVKNDGNVYVDVQYILEVRNLFGDQLAYTNVSEDEHGNKEYETEVVFPETERYNEVSWDGAPQLGIFKVKQTIRIFDEESVVEKVVFLCPIWFLIIVLIVIAIIVFEVVHTILRAKADKQG